MSNPRGVSVRIWPQNVWHLDLLHISVPISTNPGCYIQYKDPKSLILAIPSNEISVLRPYANAMLIHTISSSCLGLYHHVQLWNDFQAYRYIVCKTVYHFFNLVFQKSITVHWCTIIFPFSHSKNSFLFFWCFWIFLFFNVFVFFCFSKIFSP